MKETTPAAGAETSATETTPISTTRENAPKPNKRASIFGGLFGKKDVANPNLTENAPTVPAKDEPSTVASVAPHLDKPVTSPTAETSADVKETSGTAADATHPTTTTTPTDKRRSPFFGNFGTKKERRTGGTSDAELTDGEVKKQPSGGFGGLLRKASRAQKSPSGTTSKEADVLLPKETSNAAEPAVNGKTVTDNPAKVEGDAGNNAMTESHEQTPVSAAA